MAVKLAAMASTEKPVSMMFRRTLDANETRPSRLPRGTGTAGPPVWFCNTSISVWWIFHSILNTIARLAGVSASVFLVVHK